MNMKSFVDEMIKISAIPEFLTQHAGKAIIPGTALASILGWEKMKQLKRRHDIGKAYEEQLTARGG